MLLCPLRDIFHLKVASPVSGLLIALTVVVRLRPESRHIRVLIGQRQQTHGDIRMFTNLLAHALSHGIDIRVRAKTHRGVTANDGLRMFHNLQKQTTHIAPNIPF
jgi:hypothetical protein